MATDYVDHDVRKAGEWTARAERARTLRMQMRALRPLDLDAAAELGIDHAIAAGDVVELQPHHVLPRRAMNDARLPSYVDGVCGPGAFEPADAEAAALEVEHFSDEFGEMAGKLADGHAAHHQRQYRDHLERVRATGIPLRRQDPDEAARLVEANRAAVQAQKTRAILETRLQAERRALRAVIAAELAEGMIDAELARRSAER